jgi:hypothetical protein
MRGARITLSDGSSERVNLAGLCGRRAMAMARGPYRSRMALILHWGGPRHEEVDEVPDWMLTSSLLVYDGPRWIGVYEPVDPPKKRATRKGPAEVWVSRE